MWYKYNYNKRKGGTFLQDMDTNINTYEDSKKKILIVDDERAISDLLVFQLEKEGFQVGFGSQ